MEANIGQVMAEVAVAYWGEPQSKRGTEWRWGNHGSRTIDIKRGCYFDFEAQEGGGVVDLIRREEGSDAQIGAILEQKFGVEGGQADKVKPNEWLACAYDYIDQYGEVRYQVLRYEPKTFRQRSRGSDGNWRNSMEGIEALPYHLPDILSRPQENLYIVEGEKACDALRKEGLLVTTSHGGAGNWKPELDQWFTGRKIIILPDNDDAGRAHALKIARRIHQGNWIKIVELPGLGPKGDIVDWLRDGNTVQELKALVKATNLYDPEEDNEPDIEIAEEEEGSELYELLTAEDAMTMPPVSYLIDGLIPKNSLAMIYGTPGAGKSFLALDMALCIAHGRSWRSKETKKGGVIYLASEGFGGVGQRLRAWYSHNQVSDHCDLRFMRTAIDFIEPENIEKLIRTISNIEFNVSMIVVDTVARSFSGEENSAKEMGGFVRACGALMSATGATVLGVHHAGKAIDRGLRGSNALEGASDAILSVKKDDVGIIEVKTDKQKDAVEEPMPLKFVLEEVAISGGSSAVLVEVDSDIERDRRKKLTPREQIAFDALNNLLIDSNKNEIPVNAWHKEHVKKAPDATASNRSKARDALQLKGYIAIDNGVVWVRR